MSGNRTIISEETLLALADGDLQGEEAAAIEAAVSQDPALRDALRRLRLSSAGIAQAFDQTLDEPVPERLLAAARAAGSQKSPRARHSRATPWVWGLAASLAAFAIGLGSSYLLFSASGGYIPAAEVPSDPLAARFEVTLQSALDNGTEGQIFPYASPDIGQGKIKLGRAFAMASDSECREFWRQETRGSAQLSDHGIACRGANGSWSMMVLPGSS
jgi:anti-sigma-K factor RskA